MYDMVCTRSYLAQVVSHVCKFMSKLDKCNSEAVKWLFIYLKGTTGHCIMFNNEQGDPSIVIYIDSDYADDINDKMFTSECVFYFSRMTYLLEIISLTHSDHVNNWSRVHSGRWSCQRILVVYMIWEIIRCWARWSSVVLW